MGRTSLSYVARLCAWLDPIAPEKVLNTIKNNNPAKQPRQSCTPAATCRTPAETPNFTEVIDS